SCSVTPAARTPTASICTPTPARRRKARKTGTPTSVACSCWRRGNSRSGNSRRPAATAGGSGDPEQRLPGPGTRRPAGQVAGADIVRVRVAATRAVGSDRHRLRLRQQQRREAGHARGRNDAGATAATWEQGQERTFQITVDCIL